MKLLGANADFCPKSKFKSICKSCRRIDPDAAKEAALEPGLDFVLGSLHNLRGKPDFFEYPYESEEQCAQLNRECSKNFCRY